jgi:hypothetical protein
MANQKDIKLCECGCGRPTTIATTTNRSKGDIKGQGKRFLKGHHRRAQAGKWEDNFWKHVNKTATCWLWTGRLVKGGYGMFFLNRDGCVRGRVAHRVAYELLVGPIPEGLTLDHVKDRCNNTNCVNPAHLEPVTMRENLLRGNTVNARNAAKTHCINGHEFTDENIYRRPDDGTRMCRACIALNHAKRRR